MSDRPRTPALLVGGPKSGETLEIYPELHTFRVAKPSQPLLVMLGEYDISDMLTMVTGEYELCQCHLEERHFQWRGWDE